MPTDLCPTCNGDKGWVSTTPMVPGTNLPGWTHCPDCRPVGDLPGDTCPAGICRRAAGHAGPHRDLPVDTGNQP